MKIGTGAWPMGNEVGDKGHTGSWTSDVVVHHNAHPHQAHSNDGEKDMYTNHGFIAHHVVHDSRDKAPEHHPPKGMFDAKAVQQGSTVF